MSNSLMALILATLVAAAVAALVLAMAQTFGSGASKQIMASMPKYSLRSHSLEGEDSGSSLENSSLLLKLGMAVLTPGYRAWLTGKMNAVGQFGAKAFSLLLTKKVTFAAIGAMFGLLFFTKGFAEGLGATALFMLLGFGVPDLLLISDAQKREQAMELGLPDAIDLLNLCVESGLSFESAIARVSVSLNGPVAEEFGALISQIQLGKSRVEAMSELAERTKSKGLQQVLSALLQVDRLGAPISGVLAEQASEMRAIRKDRAREQGQKVTIKILMPLMFCFLPAMFLIVLGPAVVQLMTAMSQL